jgi:hypothetical protein
MWLYVTHRNVKFNINKDAYTCNSYVLNELGLLHSDLLATYNSQYFVIKSRAAVYPLLNCQGAIVPRQYFHHAAPGRGRLLRTYDSDTLGNNATATREINIQAGKEINIVTPQTRY